VITCGCFLNFTDRSVTDSNHRHNEIHSSSNTPLSQDDVRQFGRHKEKCDGK